jgi:hypothetical protein
MIHSGKISDIFWSSGIWFILDIGFSSKRKTCGFLLHDDEPKKAKFDEAIEAVIKAAQENKILNLVIEAPLSVAFDKYGNPKARAYEKQGNKTRYWYAGPVCAVMVAAMYLMKKVFDSNPSNEIRLFEGFVSYKSREEKSNHLRDVERLRESIRDPKKFRDCFIEPNSLAIDQDDTIESVFKVSS